MPEFPKNHVFAFGNTPVDRIEDAANLFLDEYAAGGNNTSFLEDLAAAIHSAEKTHVVLESLTQAAEYGWEADTDSHAFAIANEAADLRVGLLKTYGLKEKR